MNVGVARAGVLDDASAAAVVAVVVVGGDGTIENDAGTSASSLIAAGCDGGCDGGCNCVAEVGVLKEILSREVERAGVAGGCGGRVGSGSAC